MAGENIDLFSDFGQGSAEKKGSQGKRKYIGVTFACCDVYARIYINQAKNAYIGNCPKCAKAIRIAIGPGGTDSRFFTAQ